MVAGPDFASHLAPELSGAKNRVPAMARGVKPNLEKKMKKWLKNQEYCEREMYPCDIACK